MSLQCYDLCEVAPRVEARALREDEAARHSYRTVASTSVVGSRFQEPAYGLRFALSCSRANSSVASACSCCDDSSPRSTAFTKRAFTDADASLIVEALREETAEWCSPGQQTVSLSYGRDLTLVHGLSRYSRGVERQRVFVERSQYSVT
jgi:hypothetical protein